MKKTFEFEETIKYYHEIEVEVEDEEEEEFDDFAEDVGNNIDCGVYEDRDSVIFTFVQVYGKEKVSFTEGCPSVEIE